MATRSTIGIKRRDGSRSKIYCHWDGYIEHNGVILQMCYNTPEKIEELLKLGNLSILDEKINPTEGTPHNFDTRQEGACLAYCRDRGEEAEIEGVPWSQMEKFNYVFDCWDGVWMVGYNEFIENTPACNLLGIDGYCGSSERLLLDAIIEKSGIDWMGNPLVSKEDKEECIKKAIEGIRDNTTTPPLF